MKIPSSGSLNYDYVYSADHILLPGGTSTTWWMKTFIGGRGLNQSVALVRTGTEMWYAGQVGGEDGQFLTMYREDSMNTEYTR